jgi:GDPmannose 4,6-dehydratase
MQGTYMEKAGKVLVTGGDGFLGGHLVANLLRAGHPEIRVVDCKPPSQAAKRALITGVTGQDGSYLTEFLLAKGYEVHGLMRRASLFNTDRIDHLYHDPHLAGARLRLHYGDLTDGTGLRRVLEAVDPHEVYNLGAQSHVKVSFDIPEYTADVVAIGTLRLIEAVRDHVLQRSRQVRYYQAGSSEMFGAAPPPQNETTPFYPRSPYGVSKVAAHWFAVNYREAYGLFVCNGILFNHESPRRGETFVTRKVTRAVGRIAQGLQDKLYLGNLEAKRDWGFTGDYVKAMWLMMQQEKPDDYVIATGKSHSVRDLVEVAFAAAGLDWQRHVEVDDRYFRPTEVDELCGNPTKAHRVLGWEPRVTFPELVKMMVEHDVELARRERTVNQAGFANPARGAAMAASD